MALYNTNSYKNDGGGRPDWYKPNPIHRVDGKEVQYLPPGVAGNMQSHTPNGVWRDHPDNHQKNTNTQGSAGNAGSGGSTGTTGGGTGGGGTVASNPYADLMGLLERQRAEEQAARDRAAAAARENQLNIYNSNVDKLNRQAAQAQQQAYINYMMSKRDLPQQLSALGLSGGAAESSYAGLYNSYGNSRAQTEQARLNELGELQQTYQNNLAAIEQQRLGGELGSIGNYYANLASLAAKNAQQKASMQQNSGTGNTSNPYAKYLQSVYFDALQQGTANGYSEAEVAQQGQLAASQYVYSLLNSGLIDQATADQMMAGFR